MTSSTRHDQQRGPRSSPVFPELVTSSKQVQEESLGAESSAASASAGGGEAKVSVRRNLSQVYRYLCLAIWLGSSAIMVIDRFYWNVWPRQTVCSPGCGNDFFCDMDDDPGCLKRGPWSVQVFDAIARISARMVISTTNLLFITMCHGTWNYLSDVSALRPLLYSWRDDNFWLHSVGGWTMGVWIVAHVWSLMLPSMFHGFSNRVEGGPVALPLQVTLNTSQLNVERGIAVWGYDDVWRIVWMTLIFGFLMPLSRSAWALRKNFSLAMWLHMGLGVGVFFDSWRRTTHPHVWILNTPVVLWYLADKIWCATYGRVDPCVEATRIALDDEYMLLLWKHEETPKRICDIFWMKHSERDGNNPRRTGEMAHPFTTCSSHDILYQNVNRAPSTAVKDVRPTIEVPVQTNVSWRGHRFSLTSAISRLSNDLDSARHSDRASFFGSRQGSERLSERSLGRVFGPVGNGSLRNGAEPILCNPQTERQLSGVSPRSIAARGQLKHFGLSVKSVFSSFDEHEELQQDGSQSVLVLTEQQHQSSAETEEETLIGVDTSECGKKCTVVVGKIKASVDTHTPGGRSLVKESVERFFDEDMAGNQSSLPEKISGRPPKSETHTSTATFQRQASMKNTKAVAGSYTMAARPKASQTKEQTTRDNEKVENVSEGNGKQNNKRKVVIKRLSTTDFHEYRNQEAQEARMGALVRGAWSKMAIVRIHRRNEPKVRQCSCMGLTWMLSTFRRTETTGIADLEAQSESGCVPLRTYGPYRSGYGRLGEFPNLPPLLIIATGAGAALALDFIGYVRANKLTPARPVSVCYSSASLALLQFVTNTLLAESTPGISIKTALTRHDDLQVFDTAAGNEEELAIGRLDVKSIVAEATRHTEVYFCGGGGINKILRELCDMRGMKYVGSSVQ